MVAGFSIDSELLQPRLICSISFLHDVTVEACAGDGVGVLPRLLRVGVRRGFFEGVVDCERAGVFGAEEAVDAMSVISEAASKSSSSSSTCTAAARASISASWAAIF